MAFCWNPDVKGSLIQAWFPELCYDQYIFGIQYLQMSDS